MENVELIKPDRAREMCGGISESTLLRLIKAGDFPKPIPLNHDRHGRPVRVAFVASELRAWIEQRIHAGRPQTAA